MNRASAALAAIAALVLVAVGLLTIVDAGWRDPYADQWRMYPFYLELPFPANVLQLENGHRPILPGLVRVAELSWLNGSQTLQLTIGALAALFTVLVLASIALRDQGLSAARRWLAVALMAAAIFWLGNGRFLLHGNESVHGYLLTALLAAALALLLRSQVVRVTCSDTSVNVPPASSRLPRVLIACLCAAAASFCFGPGIAAFGAVGLLLLFERDANGGIRFASLACLAIFLVATVLAYLALPDAGGVRNVLHLEPLRNLRDASTWLASMWVHLLQPLHDPQAARALPGWLATPLAPIAQTWHALFGSLWLQPGPATALGLIAITYVIAATGVSLYRPAHAGPTRRCGLALAWFAMGVAGLVALSRMEYFSAHPDQILAQRYLPWSCLFWLGLLLTALATPSQRPWQRRWPLPLSAALVIAALVSTPAYRAWGQRVQDGLALQAAGIAVGSLSASQPLWETRLDEVEQVRPMLAARDKAMFAWPELRALHRGTSIDTTTCSQALGLQLEAIENRFGGTALALAIPAPAGLAGNTAPNRILVLDEQGHGLGLLVRQRDRGGHRYAGYTWPHVRPEAFAGARLLMHDGDRLACVARSSDLPDQAPA